LTVLPVQTLSDAKESAAVSSVLNYLSLTQGVKVKRAFDP